MPAEAASLPAAAVSAALEAAGPALPVRATGEQLDLLPKTGRVTRDDVDALPRGRGRPRGSANRRTSVWRDYLAGRYRHPLETLAAIQAADATALAAELGCKPVEALAIIKSAAAELAPYMEGKMPVAVDLAVRGDFVLAIEGLNASAAEVEELRQISFRQGEIVEAEFEEDQALSDTDGSASE